ncbi:C40 family peptidase [Geodermatophilus marinus]|uniref:C40 family peptidase n=1 Tax=Geodermatophilus sp. LHW52908 TaxID=2303986 RepID=UPI000E3C018C|nr:C40 family peptidase [Geodermatophilus sp. LHW52908]RFU21687.1 NlpC/P60 family protein [Geodermatophilus sp. LHW52908]
MGLLAAGGLVLSPLPALAAPDDPATSAEAAALVADRAHRLEVVTEEFNEARERLRAAQGAAEQAAAGVLAAEAAVADAQAAVAAARAALADARDRVRAVARGAWTGDRLGPLSAVLSSGSPEEALDRVGTLQTIADHNNGLLDGAERAGRDADRAAHDADRAAAEADRAAAAAERTRADAQQLLDRVSAQQADLDRQVAEFRAEYDRLAAEEQAAAQAAAERHAAEQAAAAESSAAAAAEDDGQQAAAPAPSGGGGSAAPAPGRAAQVAVDTAMAQIGDPYVWAAAGPNAFDCSGLVQYAFAAAGVPLPHSSRMQSQLGTPVSRSALQPGDLVFFYSPVSHVGIYIGNGQMVHASTYGQPVKVASVDAMGGYNSARRVA